MDDMIYATEKKISKIPVNVNMTLEPGIEGITTDVGLKEYDDTQKIIALHRRTDKGHKPKIFLTNCLYMLDLADTMRMIVPFYWDAGLKIVDVTAGKRIIWKHFLYNHLSPCGFEHWHIDFYDRSPDADTDHIIDARDIATTGKHWDLLVVDFPFTELKNGVESFGVRAKHLAGRAKAKVAAYNQHFRRDFYFRDFEPLAKLFPECVIPFNRVADNLIVKVGDSHKHKRLIKNTFKAIQAFDCEENPESEFNLIDVISYRGNYARRGGRFPFAQSVTSYYLIFKKDPGSR